MLERALNWNELAFRVSADRDRTARAVSVARSDNVTLEFLEEWQNLVPAPFGVAESHPSLKICRLAPLGCCSGERGSSAVNLPAAILHGSVGHRRRHVIPIVLHAREISRVKQIRRCFGPRCVV